MAASAQAASGSAGSSQARAKSLAVPVGMTAERHAEAAGERRGRAERAVAARHRDALGPHAAARSSSSGSTPKARTSAPWRRIVRGERLGVEAPAGGRVGDQRDAHAEPGYRRSV